MTSVSVFEVLYTVSGLPAEEKGDARLRIYNGLWIRGDLLRAVNIGIGDALLVSVYWRSYTMVLTSVRFIVAGSSASIMFG